MTDPGIQRIARYTSLDDIVAAIEAAAKPVRVQELAVASALGGVIARDIAIEVPRPPAALALRDGWAVVAEATADAGAYAPAPLPQAVRIEAGQPMPEGADAVAPPDVIALRDGVAQALAPVVPGEGVLPVGGDVAAGMTLLQRGRRFTHVHAAVLAAAGVDRVAVRKPYVRIVTARPAGDAVIDAAVVCIGSVIARQGAIATASESPLAEAIADEGADTVIAIGGTGSSRNDAAVRTMAAAGQLIAHGIALSPGETAAFGIIGDRPVLALPGRLDAALAVWHVLGCPLMMRLTGCCEPVRMRTVRLTHKIASTVGMAELVPVRVNGREATPIASGYVPLAALAQADGWILVRPESEGYPGGSEVVLRPFP
jgi:molybdopterin biosynthesis enzyme